MIRTNLQVYWHGHKVLHPLRLGIPSIMVTICQLSPGRILTVINGKIHSKFKVRASRASPMR